MSAAYILRKAANGEFFFNLTAGNNKKILSSETYKNRAGAQNGIESVRANSPLKARYERKTTDDGKPYFVLLAANNEIIGRSQTYSSAAAMERGIASVTRNGRRAMLRDES